jgi:glycosyltransferase involved in cell wall biosynthesis
MNTIAVSVVIPARNAAPYMRKLLHTLADNKTIRQIIVVDDCSTDATAEIVTRFAKADARIRLIRQEANAGAGAARNRGLLEVKSTYCMFLDADDDIRAKAVDEAASVLNAKGGDFLVYKWAYADMHGKVNEYKMLEQDECLWHAANNGAKIFSCTMLEHPDMVRTANFPWNKVYRTEFLFKNNIHFSETFVHNDNLAHWMSYLTSTSFVLYDAYLINHKEDKNRSQLTQVWDWKRLEIFDVFDEIDAFFGANAEQFLVFYHQFVRYKLQMIRWIGENIQNDVLHIFCSKIKRTLDNVDSRLFFMMLANDPLAGKELYDIKFDPYVFFKNLRG